MSTRVIRNLAILLAAVQAAAIVYGVVASDAATTSEFFGNVWGHVTLIDIYLAFGAAWAWIAWREASRSRAALSAVLVAVTGSLAIWAYVAYAANESRDVRGLLIGPKRA